MSQWWSTRSPRERFLIAFAGFLLAAALIWQFAVKPSYDALDRAKVAHQTASQIHARLDRMEDMLRQGETIRAARAAAPVDAQTIRAEVTAFGTSAGLTPETSDAAEPGSVRAAVRDATAPAIFAWIEQVETGLGLSVSRATLQQNTAGDMDAEVIFRADSAQ
ncbi:MAG: type II secretion system protein GspM [Hyphomonas sp.]